MQVAQSCSDNQGPTVFGSAQTYSIPDALQAPLQLKATVQPMSRIWYNELIEWERPTV